MFVEHVRQSEFDQKRDSQFVLYSNNNAVA